MPCARKCGLCGTRYAVSFATAVGASALVGSEVWRACWTEVVK